MTDPEPTLHVLVDDRNRSAESVVRITVEDLETGETQSRDLPRGDYFLLATEPAYVAHIAAHKTGTHVITVKGRLPA